MTHTIREKSKLLNRVRRIRGQVDAIERGLEQDIDCADVMQLIAAVRGAMGGLMAEVMEDHVRLHVTETQPVFAREQAAQELIGVVRCYFK